VFGTVTGTGQKILARPLGLRYLRWAGAIGVLKPPFWTLSGKRMNVADRQAALTRARSGDQEALGALLESYRPYIDVLVRALRGDRATGRAGDSDVVQDVFLFVCRGFPAFRGTTVPEFTAWLRQQVIGAVGRVLRTHLGTDKRSCAHEEAADSLPEFEDSSDTPATKAIRHEQSARMAQVIARLPDDMQQVLLGRFLDDLPYATLADRLGRSEAAVRMLCLRALRRLHDEYQGGTGLE
jgi:RNA polymerase sigma-70 factor (ECF subfamily)